MIYDILYLLLVRWCADRVEGCWFGKKLRFSTAPPPLPLQPCVSNLMTVPRSLLPLLHKLILSHWVKIHAHCKPIILLRQKTLLQLQRWVFFLYTWVRASWIEFNNCPTRCTLFSLLHFCRQLYTFRVLTPINRGWYSCNYSFWYWLTGSTNIRSRCWVGTDSCVS